MKCPPVISRFVAAAVWAVLAIGAPMANALDETVPLISLNRTNLQTPSLNVPLAVPSVPTGFVPVSRRLRVELLWEPATRSLAQGNVWNYSVSYTIGNDVTVHSLAISERGSSSNFQAQLIHPFMSAPASLHIQSAADATPAGGWTAQETTVIAVPEAVRLVVWLEQTIATAAAPSQVSSVSLSGGVLSWTPIAGVDEYEVEWTYLDRYDASPGVTPFEKKKAVRISTTLATHTLGTTYAEGSLVARVRAVSRHVIDDPASPGQKKLGGRRAGAWSTNVSLTLGTGPGETTPFEQNKNWRYLATYSEGGRRKESVGYYDGTLRSRQALTTLTSDDSVLIAETKYDLMGRAAMEILPAAVRGRDLRYRQGFNRLANGAELRPSAIDGPSPPQLSSCTGAGFYYGVATEACASPLPALPSNDPFRSLVPDSEGYPYSRTEYQRDGAGLPRSQSGVGKQLLSHPTAFQYASAEAFRLRKLFGSNAGNPRNYQLNVNVDSNSQGRASYLDKNERVVATSLIGNKPPSLDSIRSYDTLLQTAPIKQVVLLWRDGTFDAAVDSGNDIDPVTGTSRMGKIITNLAPTNYSFSYVFSGADYGAPPQPIGDTGQSFPAMCVSCSYEVAIRIVKPDGTLAALCDPVAPATCQTEIRRTFSGGQDQCGIARPPQTVQFTASLGAGEFRIVKVLTIASGTDTQALDLLTQGKDTIRGIVINNGRGGADTGHCAIGCEASCEQDFSADPSALSKCKQNCAAIVADATLGAALNQCSSLLTAMKADVSPWGYLFEDPVWLSTNGPSVISPYPGSSAAIAEVWDPTWADGLVAAHPEYRHYTRCTQLGASHNYDGLMMQAQTWSAALAGGFLNPMRLNPTPGLNPTIAGTEDPYFNAYTGKGRLRRADMRNALLAYTSRFAACEPGTAKSLWEFVSDPAIYPNGVAPDPDTQWRMFRGIYLGLKEQFEAGIRQTVLGIEYLDSPRAHVKLPLAGRSWEEIQAIGMEQAEQIYSQFCPWQAAQWTSAMVASCNLPEATVNAIKPPLEEYCRLETAASGPLVQFSPAAIASSPLLQQVAVQLPPECKLDGLSTTLPVEWACQTGCCQRQEANGCLIDVLKGLPGSVNTEVPFKCVRWDARARVTPDGFVIVGKGRNSARCHIAIVDQTGQLVDLGRIQGIVGVSATAEVSPSTAPPGTHYAGVVVTARLVGQTQPVELYVYTSCQTRLVKTQVVPCEGSEIAQLCKPASTLATTWAKLLGNSTARYRAISRILRKEPAAEPECKPAKQASDCMRAALSSLNKGGGRKGRSKLPCDCRYYLYRANGEKIEVAMIVDVIGAPIPAEHALSGGEGTYTGFKVLVGMGGGKTAWVYIHSSCAEQLLEACVAVPTFAIAAPPPPDPQQCIDDAKDRGEADADYRFTRDLGDATNQIYTRHVGNCMQGALVEKLSYQSQETEHHFVAYYHDQGGNLVQTVPPEGIREATLASDGQTIVAEPAHRLTSRFRYNSRNQVTWQATPDSKEKSLLYDDAGQLRFTQNAEQATPVTAAGVDTVRYSYTKYDKLGRTVQTGVMTGTTASLAAAIVPANLVIAAFPFDPADFAGGGGTPAYSLSQRTHTYYDTIDPIYQCGDVQQMGGSCSETAPLSSCVPLAPQNLRGRVAAIARERVRDDGVREHTVSCYSYDPHGHVASLLQAIPGLGAKRIDYEFDVVGGDIRKMRYQWAQADHFQQSYIYDADHRMIEARSSTDGVTWHRDAMYAYFKHGPLARTILGDQRVQGLDYVYTLQGWLKGVNSDTLRSDRDPGTDGAAIGATSGTALTTQLASAVARDVIGLGFHYFPGDYKAIGSSTAFVSQTYSNGTSYAPSTFARDVCPDSGVSRDSCGLYDGNISSMVVANRLFMASAASSPLGSAYRYDQLGRLTRSKTHRSLDTGAGQWSAAPSTDQSYKMALTYDGNGNILTLKRYGDGTGVASEVDHKMDDLTYCYDADQSCGDALPNSDLRSNRLLHIRDDNGISLPTDYAARYANDVEDQGSFLTADPSTHNYRYDKLGNLTADRSEGILDVKWTNTGRVESILMQRPAGSASLRFGYDGEGNRVMREFRDGTTVNTEYLVRDARGKVIAVYETETPVAGPSAAPVARGFVLQGIDRLGELRPNGSGPIASPGTPFERRVGQRRFQLTDHLQSVLAVVSDRRQATGDMALPRVDYFSAQQVSAVDYYPFGMELRKNANPPGAPVYSYGFNGFLREDKITGEAKTYQTSARLYDARIGRWWAVDPVSNPGGTSYAGMGNDPINNVDPSGAKEKRSKARGKSCISESPECSGNTSQQDKNQVAAVLDFSDHLDGHMAWSRGEPIGQIETTEIDGKLVELRTAAAFERLAEAAAKDKEKLNIDVVSGWRNNIEQTRLWWMLILGERTAAVGNPTFSNHQNGIALDLTVGEGDRLMIVGGEKKLNKRGKCTNCVVIRDNPIYRWMAEHAQEYGFVRTVPSEPWHWEYRPVLAEKRASPVRLWPTENDVVTAAPKAKAKANKTKKGK